jgi:hypothetical protein
VQIHTKDPEIIAIRTCWQNGLTLSQAAKRLRERHGTENNPKPREQWRQREWFIFESPAKLIREWKEMRKLFGHGSLPWAYLRGVTLSGRSRAFEAPSAQELNTPVGPLDVGRTYGDWKGITGPGKQLRDMLKRENSNSPPKG